MTNTAKMSSRQSEATRDLKKRNKQVNITTMKRYIKPTIEFIEVETVPILDGSIWMGSNGETVNPDEDEDIQLTGGHRGDWDNIWGGM